MLKPVAVKALPGYKLHLRYEDGVEGDVDLSHLMGKGVFALWNDPQAFEHVSIAVDGAITWSDKVDICADALYMQITGKSPDDVFPKLRKADVNA